jgi:hypothetical protein
MSLWMIIGSRYQFRVFALRRKKSRRRLIPKNERMKNKSVVDATAPELPAKRTLLRYPHVCTPKCTI